MLGSSLTRSFLVFPFSLLLACAVDGAGDLGENNGGGSGGKVSAGGSSTGGGGLTNAGGKGGGVAIGGSSATGGDAGTPAVGGTSGAGGAKPTCAEPPPDTPTTEVCGNGLDDDLDGFVDEGCSCNVGQTQACFGGTPSQSTASNCVKGTQSCVASGEFAEWGPCQNWNCGPETPPAEICDNGIDEDCDGIIDEGCSLTVPVNIDGDCVSAYCPPQAPYPVGCNITMKGDDSRGCVANTPGSSSVYFKEGDKCPSDWCSFCGDPGHVSGTLLCSSQQLTTGLNETNCPINKTNKLYPTSASGCPG